METITQSELNKMLANAANSDMRIARRSGEMTICQTRVGNIDLKFHAAERGYSAFQSQEVEGKRHTGIMKAAAMVAFLSARYVVDLVDTTVVADAA